MLVSFSFKNHRSFKDEAFLNLSASAEKRHQETLINNLVPVVAIHGANASGKTNVLDALNLMIYFMKNSFIFDANNGLSRAAFKFVKDYLKDPTEFELTILMNGYLYRYGFLFDDDVIIEEWLYEKKHSIDNRSVEKLVFERQNKKIVFGKKYKKQEKIWGLFKDVVNSQKILVFSILSLKESEGIFKDLKDYINNIHVRVDNLNSSLSINILKQDNKLFNEFQKIINEFDPCLLGIDITKKDINGKEEYIISGIHKRVDSNEEVMIPIDEESFGTWKIFSIIPIILYTLEHGGLLAIDELDVKLHPLLFRRIVKMFCNKEMNKNNAQLIFTTHSTFLLNSNDLRRDEIYLVEKDLNGKSTLYSLADFKNLRIDTDYEKKYLTGQLGAIPFINEE